MASVAMLNNKDGNFLGTKWESIAESVVKLVSNQKEDERDINLSHNVTNNRIQCAVRARERNENTNRQHTTRMDQQTHATKPRKRVPNKSRP